MNALRVLRRTVALLALLVFGIVATILMSFTVRDGIPDHRYKALRQWWLARVARLAGVRTVVRGTPAADPALWISNHISWLDIPVLGGAAPIGFLSKAEVRQWPVIGWLAKQAGTLFIARGARDASSRAAAELQSHLQNSHSVLLFPEGTTSSGEALLRFHARPFAPAMSLGMQIQPVALQYLEDDGQRNLDVPFIDDDTFVDSIRRVLTRPHTRAEVIFLPPVDSAAFNDRKSLANYLQQQVAATLYPDTQAGTEITTENLPF